MCVSSGTGQLKVCSRGDEDPIGSVPYHSRGEELGGTVVSKRWQKFASDVRPSGLGDRESASE